MLASPDCLSVEKGQVELLSDILRVNIFKKKESSFIVVTWHEKSSGFNPAATAPNEESLYSKMYIINLVREIFCSYHETLLAS